MSAAIFAPERFVGRSLDRLTLSEREALIGKFAAQEIYSPKTLPLQRLEALGDSIQDCIGQLRARGLDPLNFEFTQLGPPY
jgi:hypothetical protein